MLPIGGPDRTRTRYLLRAKQMLSQLSYWPILVDLARIELAPSSEVCLVIPNSDFIPPVRAAHLELKTHIMALS